MLQNARSPASSGSLARPHHHHRFGLKAAASGGPPSAPRISAGRRAPPCVRRGAAWWGGLGGPKAGRALSGSRYRLRRRLRRRRGIPCGGGAVAKTAASREAAAPGGEGAAATVQVHTEHWNARAHTHINTHLEPVQQPEGDPVARRREDGAQRLVRRPPGGGIGTGRRPSHSHAIVQSYKYDNQHIAQLDFRWKGAGSWAALGTVGGPTQPEHRAGRAGRASGPRSPGEHRGRRALVAGV